MGLAYRPWRVMNPPVNGHRGETNSSRRMFPVIATAAYPGKIPRAAQQQTMFGSNHGTMTHQNGKRRASIMRFPMIAAISLSIISCEKRTQTSGDNDNDHSRTIQRIELLEQRVQTLMDQQQQDEARQRAEEQGFKVHEIKPKPDKQAAPEQPPPAPIPK